MSGAAMNRNSPVIWAFVIAGVLGGFALFGSLFCCPGQSYTMDNVTVEEISGSRDEVLAHSKKYLRIPGFDSPYVETAKIGSAVSFPALERPMNAGDSRHGTLLETTPQAIRHELENLAPGQSVLWFWENEQDSNTWRKIDVSQGEDGSYHVTVKDIWRVPIEED